MAAIAADAGETMRVKRLRPSAVLPVRGSAGAAGFDLAAEEASVVPAQGSAVVKTGLSIAIPWGTYARIAPRSGLAVKKKIDVFAGVVDFDYRGEVGVVLFNHGHEDFVVAQGDRVAQLVLERISMAPCEEVDRLEETARGVGGFGSTGVGGPSSPTKYRKIEGDGEGGTAAAVAAHGWPPASPVKVGELSRMRGEVKALRQELAALRAERDGR